MSLVLRTRRFAKESGAGRTGSSRRAAGVVAVLAWATFWLGLTLSPCCEALAAVFRGHVNVVSHSVPANQPAHHAGTANPASMHADPDPACDYTFAADLPLVGEYARLASKRLIPDWFATPASVDALLAAAGHVAYVALVRAPPLLRLYLRTRRLLI